MNLGPLVFKNLSKNVPKRFGFDVESKSVKNTKVCNHQVKDRSGPAPDWTSPRVGPHLELFFSIMPRSGPPQDLSNPQGGPRHKYFTHHSIGIRPRVLVDSLRRTMTLTLHLIKSFLSLSLAKISPLLGQSLLG